MIPGVVISDQFFAECERQAKAPTAEQLFFRELAAKQLAIFRGLGFAGGYLGGVHAIEDVQAILEIESAFAYRRLEAICPRDSIPGRPKSFTYFARDDSTGAGRFIAAEPGLRSVAAEASRIAQRHVDLSLQQAGSRRCVYAGPRLHDWARSIYAASRNPKQGPPLLRVIEHASKSAMFRCKDCGDCSLPGHRVPLPRITVCEESTKRPLRRHARRPLRSRRFRVHLEPRLRPTQVRGPRASAARPCTRDSRRIAPRHIELGQRLARQGSCSAPAKRMAADTVNNPTIESPSQKSGVEVNGHCAAQTADSPVATQSASL